LIRKLLKECKKRMKSMKKDAQMKTRNLKKSKIVMAIKFLKRKLTRRR